jgi:serine/threonine protein kinase
LAGAQDADGGQIAVKLPHKDQVDWQHITQEIGLWTLCGKHKNVLPLIGARNFNGQIAIISEYAPDGSLEDLLNGKGSLAASLKKQEKLTVVRKLVNQQGQEIEICKLSVEEAVGMTVGILKGLQHLHESGIIHRDLKPDNILLDGKTPRLTDFGISRVISENCLSRTVAGTLAYMALECFDGRRNAQTDIWSVGVILYRMLTGKLPFAQKTQVELVGALAMKDPEPLPDNIPNAVQKIVMRALAKEPAECYQTADEMAKDLRQLLPEDAQPSPSNVVPPPDSSPIINEPVTDKSDSVVTNAKVPFDNYETKTIIRPVSSQNPQTTNLSIYLLSAIGLLFVIITVGVYFSSGNKTELANTISNGNSKTSPTSTPSPIVIGNNMVLSNNENTSINVVNTNSNKIEELRQQLKKELDRYLNATTKSFLKDNGNSAKGKTTVKKSFYKDVDSDGLEDAVFLLQGYLEQSDYFWDGFVFYRNDGERFVFGGDHFFGGAEYITVKKFEVKTGSIYAEVELLEGGESNGKIENYTFVVKNNRIEKK